MQVWGARGECGDGGVDLFHCSYFIPPLPSHQALLTAIPGGLGVGEALALRIGRDVLTGLHTLHSNGLVYGDMKVGVVFFLTPFLSPLTFLTPFLSLPPCKQPSNVFIGGSESRPEYKIGDYGTMREAGRQHLHYFVGGGKGGGRGQCTGEGRAPG